MQKKVKQFRVKVKEVKRVKDDIFLISFQSIHLAKTAQPGNFLHIKIETIILRRPLSIHKVDKNLIYILFKVRGKGTEALSKKRKESQLDIIGPLGNGFRLDEDTNSVLVAGGIGVAPLVFLAKKLKEIRNPKSEIRNIILLGAKDKRELVCEKEFRNLGFKVKVATEDGSKGRKGFVTNLLKDQLRTLDLELRTSIYACGPKDMFYQIHKTTKKKKNLNTQVSFEQFMGCGLGVCCACVIATKSGYKKVCQDGPVFDLNNIWG